LSASASYQSNIEHCASHILSPVTHLATRRWLLPAAAIAVLALLMLALWVAIERPSGHGDSNGLALEAGRVVDCLRHRVFTNCNTWHGSTAAPGTGPYPIFQYVPAVALRAVGVSRGSTLRVLIAINGLSLLVLAGATWLTLRRIADVTWRLVLTAALIASPLLWYGYAAFGEALGAALILVATAAMLLRAPPLVIGVLVAIACMTKETNPLFIAVIAAVCLFARGVEQDDRKRQRIVAAAIGIGTGVVVNSVFNVFRFGSIRNTIYLRYPHPRLGVAERTFAAEWIAPNYGIIWFWPLTVVILAVTATGAIWTLRRRGWRVADGAPLVAAALFVADFVGLAFWYAPFGGVSYGPRLMLTLTPALLLVAAAFASKRATRTLQRILAGAWIWPLMAATLALGIPEATVLFNPRVLDFLGRPKICRARPVPLPHACTVDAVWSKRPYQLQYALNGWHTKGGKLAATLFTIAIVLLFLAARDFARRSLADAPPTMDTHNAVSNRTTDTTPPTDLAHDEIDALPTPPVATKSLTTNLTDHQASVLPPQGTSRSPNTAHT
jgi:hypothetical protein